MLISRGEMKELWSLLPEETWREPLTSLMTMISMAEGSSWLRTRIKGEVGVDDLDLDPDLEGQEDHDPRDPGLGQGPNLGIGQGPKERDPSQGPDLSQETKVAQSPDPDQDPRKDQSLDQDPRKDQSLDQTLTKGPGQGPPKEKGQGLSPPKETGLDLDQSLPKETGQDLDQSLLREKDPGQDLSLLRGKDLDQDQSLRRETSLDPDLGPGLNL